MPVLKPSSYSRTLNTKYTDPLRPERETWTPVGRDAEWESRILADLGKRVSLSEFAVPGPEPDDRTLEAVPEPSEPEVMPLEEGTPPTTESVEDIPSPAS